jgi:hypothetical protein
MINYKLNFKITTIDLETMRESIIDDNLILELNIDLKFKEVIEVIRNKYNANKLFYESIIWTLWSEYFPDDVCKMIDNYNYLEMTLEQLEAQFNIISKKFEIIVNPYGIGATVACLEGIRIFFHTNEKDLHHIPHVHCSYAEEEFRINLVDNELFKNDESFKSNKKTRVAFDFVKKNQNNLINYWNKVVVRGENMKFEIEI